MLALPKVEHTSMVLIHSPLPGAPIVYNATLALAATASVLMGVGWGGKLGKGVYKVGGDGIIQV